MDEEGGRSRRMFVFVGVLRVGSPVLARIHLEDCSFMTLTEGARWLVNCVEGGVEDQRGRTERLLIAFPWTSLREQAIELPVPISIIIPSQR